MNYPGEPEVFGGPEYKTTPVYPERPQYDAGPDVDGAKYVIFKTEDWNALINEIGNRFTNRADHMQAILRQAHASMVGDGVVIRRQDAFSPAPLHMYSLMMESTIAALKKQPGGFNEQFVRHLQSRADYFHEEAMRAEEENYKIPD